MLSYLSFIQMLADLYNTMNQSKKWKIGIFFTAWVNWKISSIGPKYPTKNPRISSNDPGGPVRALICYNNNLTKRNIKFQSGKNSFCEWNLLTYTISISLLCVSQKYFVIFNLISRYVSSASKKLLKNKGLVDLLHEIKLWYK